VREFDGSTKMARMISEKGQAADIMASADFAVIDKNLIPAKEAWNIRFATNQMVLCYTAQSRYADSVNADNWLSMFPHALIFNGFPPQADQCFCRRQIRI